MAKITNTIKKQKSGNCCPRCGWGTLQEKDNGDIHCYACKYPRQPAGAMLTQAILELASKESKGEGVAATTVLAHNLETTPATVRRVLRAKGWQAYMTTVDVDGETVRAQCWASPKRKSSGIDGVLFMAAPKHLQVPDPSKSHPKAAEKAAE